MGVKGHIAFLKEFFALEIATAMEYRANFIIQSVGMIVNDLFWIAFWFLFFQRFQSVNGWQFREMMMVYAMIVTAFGLHGVLFGRIGEMTRIIERGGLDYYLSLPKNVLLHSILKISYECFGDLVMGLIIAVFAVPLQKWPLFLLLVITSNMVIMGWFILMNSLSFYFGRFEEAANAAASSLIMLSSYPFSVFSGLSKFILLLVIPAGFVSGVPVELMISFSWKWLLATLGFSTVFLCFAVWVFNRGLKHYESGSVLGTRG
jgi:ABC-2 type transport system permease protein